MTPMTSVGQGFGDPWRVTGKGVRGVHLSEGSG